MQKATEIEEEIEQTYLCTILHDETQHTIARTTNRKPTNKFITKALSLSDSAETAISDLLNKKLDRVLRECKPLLDDGGKLANTAALLAKHRLRAGSADDHLGLRGRHANFDAGVALLGKLAGQQFIQLGIQHTVRDKLLLLRDVGRHIGCSGWKEDGLEENA